TDPNSPDFLDSDSDGDGCSDANEAFASATADGGDGAQYGTGDPLTIDEGEVNANGTVTTANYTTGTNINVITAGPDTDGDNLSAACDLDDDGDGNPDATDPNKAIAIAIGDIANADVGEPVVISVLDNDDYLDNNDPANEGTTTVIDLETGTATGMVSIDPVTGVVTYIPAPNENGDVTIVYEVCNDASGIAPNNVCSQATITITVTGTDTDGDGVVDIDDLDDDNDGVLDVVESGGVNPNEDIDGDGIPAYLDDNDNDMGIGDTNGVESIFDIDGDGVPNHLDLDADNDGIYDVIETGGTDNNGDGEADDNDSNPSNNNGVPNTANSGTGNMPINSGTDPVTPDFLDTDSDEDGCSDANEAFGSATADGGDGEQFGVGDPLTVVEGEIRVNGTVVSANYMNGTDISVTTAGVDLDLDGLVGSCDPDVDGDGNPDANDPNPMLPTVMDDTATIDVGMPSSVVVDVLDNDDYLANNDSNNIGVTTLTDTGLGTATGTVITDPDTGEITYTPSPTEAGSTVTIIYEVCNDESGTNICTQGTLTIEVTGMDTDGDGIADIIDLDDDNDGIPDAVEIATAINGGDTDKDGIPDIVDLDSDGDGIWDAIEAGGEDPDSDGIIGTGAIVDTDGDGLSDIVDEDDGGTVLPIIDTDEDGLPDFQDTDDDNDDILTINENPDPNGDGNPVDALDSNDNGIPDYLDSNNDSASGCLKVYNEFTPNNDGENEELVISCIENYKNNTIEIFNRWGNTVYKAQGYNNRDIVFKGLSNGRATIKVNEELPVGTYFYVLDLGDGSKPRVGWIYINR
ncbi:gliding motility-associated C-terminal domain-containing protein, partial [Tenacibaculum sp.]|nr:gliding motility-associated C-terminal domain-containing protein [Tenacibaculum sp.]